MTVSDIKHMDGGTMTRRAAKECGCDCKGKCKTKKVKDRELWKLEGSSAPFKVIRECPKCDAVLCYYVNSKLSFWNNRHKVVKYGMTIHAYELRKGLTSPRHREPTVTGRSTTDFCPNSENVRPKRKPVMVEDVDFSIIEQRWLEKLHETANYVKEKEKDMTTKLYTWKDGETELFGHHIGTMSDGRWVMEVKGTNGNTATVEKKTVEEVMPYTVGVVFGKDDAASSNCYHYFAKEGDYEIGDFVIVDGEFARVVKIGTKSRRANKWLVSFKLEGKWVEYDNDELI